MEIKGKVIQHTAIKSGTSAAGKEWKSQNFIVEEVEGQYPKKICCQLFGDKILIIPDIGLEVNVHVNIESKEHNGNWFTSLNAWKIDVFSQGNNSPLPVGEQPAF